MSMYCAVCNGKLDWIACYNDKCSEPHCPWHAPKADHLVRAVRGSTLRGERRLPNAREGEHA
jgi:hypothetical protein